MRTLLHGDGDFKVIDAETLHSDNFIECKT